MSLSIMSFLVGLMIGLTSMGGAALMAPLLILVFGVRPVTAVGTDLVYGAVTKIFAAVYHVRRGTADLGIVRNLAMGSLPAGIAGSALALVLPGVSSDADHLIKRAMGILLVVIGVGLLLRLILPLADVEARISARLLRAPARGCVIWGAMVGFCVGLTSVGSGSLMAPFLILLFPKSPVRVVGTDILHAAVLVSVSSLAHIAGGLVEWGLVPALLVGAIPGVLIGSRLAEHLPVTVTRMSLAVMLATTGLHIM